MRFEEVTAISFGPFAGETLELAPGFTIVHGPNEAGKTTWHGAIYAGLCGQRRGKGKPRAQDKRFEEAHRPWSTDAWRVSARVSLDDGRQIELTHDLDGRVDCRAVDADLGRDISADLIFDGAPDGSRLLGLDRKVFLATACVRQNDLLGLLEEPRLLQEYLQRAAATAATDGNAAAALTAIDEFRGAQVGLDRANSVRPLRRAIEAVSSAEETLRAAGVEHANLLDLHQRCAVAEQQAGAAEKNLRVAEAGAALRSARAAQAKLERARALAAAFDDGPPPPIDTEANRERDVAAALQAFRARPEAPALTGRTAAEMEQELAHLREQTSAAETKDAHGRDEEVPPVDPALPGRVEALREQLNTQPRRRALPALVAATLLGAGGAVAFALGAWYAAVPLCLIAAGVAAWAYWRGGSAGRVHLLEELREAEGRLASERQAREQAQRRREETQAQTRAAAARRADLERNITQRMALEDNASGAARRRDEARAAVIAAATGCGLDTRDEVDAAAKLEGWQRSQQERLATHQKRLEDWTALQALVGGRTLSELESWAWELAREAAAKGAGLDKALVEPTASDEHPTDIPTLRQVAAAAHEEATALRARTDERTNRGGADVPGAEEALAIARGELARVRDLAETLDLTRAFLAQAQERAHRDIAPVIRASIEPALAAVTAGRYPEARVDPENLEVTVRTAGGSWRSAASLSHGTTEQIYLLLRVALAQHLGNPEESCPLLLDDVTTHCDEERTTAVLDLLHRLSAGRQVILFSQQAQVADWAERHLGDRDRLVRLKRVPLS